LKMAMLAFLPTYRYYMELFPELESISVMRIGAEQQLKRKRP